MYKGHANLVRSLYLDSANGRVVSGSYDQGIRVFDFTTGEEVGVYENWTTSWILAAKSDYRRIVATSQDGRALLMDFGYDVKYADLLRNNEIETRAAPEKLNQSSPAWVKSTGGQIPAFNSNSLLA
jgi:WD40 repeat protein